MRKLAPVVLVFSLAWSLGPACDQDDSATTSSHQWWGTCGDPVCSGYGGPFPGVALCSDLGIAIGDTCPTSDAGLLCDPVDDCNARLTCADSDPTQQPGGCPISKAEHKESIVYLSADQRAAAHKDVVDMKLATWRYKGALDDGSQHLGFLIDDEPGSPAVRPDGEHVDLYGYTSLAVAAIQEQEARIQALEAKLEALAAQCGTDR